MYAAEDAARTVHAIEPFEHYLRSIRNRFAKAHPNIKVRRSALGGLLAARYALQ